MAAAEWVYGQSARDGCSGRRFVQDVVHEYDAGNTHSFGGEYLELVPNERIRHTDKFDDPNMPGEMQTTITFRQVLVGTEVDILQEGIPDMIPVEMCYLGWQESLNLLALLVEPEIPMP